MGCSVAKQLPPGQQQQTVVRVEPMLPSQSPNLEATAIPRPLSFDAQPQLPLSELCGAKEPPLPDPNQTLQEWWLSALDKWSAESPPREFLCEYSVGKRHTYSELRHMVDQISSKLMASGLLAPPPRTTRIALCLPDNFEAMALLLGVTATPGVCPVHISPSFGSVDFLSAWKATRFSAAFLLVV